MLYDNQNHYEYESNRQADYESEIERLRDYYTEPHCFDAPEDNKSSRFCKCGLYLTDDIHFRENDLSK